MATYLFKCENCGEIEITQSIHLDFPTECPDCNGKIEKVWQMKNVGISFKGSGFYSTGG